MSEQQARIAVNCAVRYAYRRLLARMQDVLLYFMN
jgi:hypothetical protein